MIKSRLRPAVTLATALAVTAALSLSAAGPASAHSDRERIDKVLAENAASPSDPLVTSSNVEHVRNVPGQVGISGCFTKTKPLFVTSGLDSVKVFNVRNPLEPKLTGTLPNAVFENEAMNCGERRTKSGTKRFALIGVDLVQASPDKNGIDHTNVGGGELMIVDVTDPANPRIQSRAPGTTSTHTVACVEQTDCRYAYSAGDSGDQTFSIFNLTNLDKPREVDSNPQRDGVQPFSSPTAAHKWNFDNAGYGTHTGFDGSSMFDVSLPRQPELVTTTGAAGRGENADGTKNGYNDFIHHNSFRPNAKAFRPGAEPSIANGNVLLVTEEDYEDVNCSTAGSFQTWHVKRLNGAPDAIVPLDKVELTDLDPTALPANGFCSSHWFDYHPSGVVSVGFYGGGTQLVDVRNPKEIKSHGKAVWPGSEVWDSYWVPVFNKNGVDTGKKTNLAYSIDLIRGLDVYSVDLPGGARVTNNVSLASTNPFASFSWPEDVVPMSLIAFALGGFLVLRRRAKVVDSR
ncbi:MAG TPA: hypothetical protein VFD59_11515 [Nocardioidaceae bacterium]|nr:hypothetical protein [Nocardioidaceae bacterium]